MKLYHGAVLYIGGSNPVCGSDPLRVLPSCIIGSAVAGGLSMALGCQLRAPHGGLFVVPVIQNPFGFILALIAGSVVGMLLLALLKKPVKGIKNNRTRGKLGRQDSASFYITPKCAQSALLF